MISFVRVCATSKFLKSASTLAEYLGGSSLISRMVISLILAIDLSLVFHIRRAVSGSNCSPWLHIERRKFSKQMTPPRWLFSVVITTAWPVLVPDARLALFSLKKS
jgi:hypothetical protein